MLKNIQPQENILSDWDVDASESSGDFIADMLAGKNILTGLIWDSQEVKDSNHGYAQWMSSIRRSHKAYLYSITDDEGKSDRELAGYSARTAPGCEPFAVHLRNLYGDGVYYRRVGDNGYYVLIILDGIIINGTDFVVGSAFFNELISLLPTSRYSELQVSALTNIQLDTIISSCEERQVVYKKKQRMFWISSCIGILIAFIAVATLLYSMIAG